MTAKRFNIVVISLTLFLIILSIAVTVIVDPFLHYHTPISELKSSFAYKEEYAMYWTQGRAKSIKTDSVIIGSSLVNHIKAAELSKLYSVDCITLAKASGRPNIYYDFIQASLNNNDLKYVFYEMTLPHWSSDYSGEIPEYLYNDSVFDDVSYVLNKDVLAQTGDIIKRYLKQNGEVKEAVAQQPKIEIDTLQETTRYSMETVANGSYTRSSAKVEAEKVDEFSRLAHANMEKYIIPLVRDNPNTEFVFIVTPTSILLYYNYFYQSVLDEYLLAFEDIMKTLLAYDNVEIHMFSDAEGYVDNLDNYMDRSHYSPAGAELVYDGLKTGKYEITPENISERMKHLKTMAETYEIPFLKKGFSGDDVLELQKELKSLGYTISTNGNYTKTTVKAVEAFQADNGLQVTGIAFPETRDLLKEKAAAD